MEAMTIAQHAQNQPRLTGASSAQSTAANPIPAGSPQAKACTAQRPLDRRLHALIARSRHAPVRATLALLQLANFYEVAHWVGESGASQLLADINQLLREALPAGAMLCRCDHYEFAVLLEDKHSDQAADIAQRVKTALQAAAPAAVPDPVSLQCVVGLASLERDIRLPDMLFARARHSLGRRHSRPMPDQRQSRAIARLILQGLRSNQLTLTFQPLVPLRVGQAGCHEVRCQLRTSRGRLSGRMLTRAAVHCGLGGSLDRWLVRASLARLQQNELADAAVVVNLSLTSLVGGHFTDWLCKLLATTGFSCGSLILQISELDLLVAQHHLRPFSMALKTMGVPLAITHFGCSQQAQRYMPLLRATQIKLDYSLLGNLAPDSKPFHSLTELITSLHSQHIRIAAGQVSDLRSLPLLWQAGVDLVQGRALQSPARMLGRDCAVECIFTD